MDTERRHPLLAGRYRLIEQLGRGGMGVVWLAIDEVLDREVAAKEVRAPENMGEDDVRVLYARLKQEARAAARISHPNVITVHDVVEQGDRPWIVMEYVRGQALADVLAAEGALQAKEAARIGALVLQALRAAHAVGVLHRDVKPANVLLEAGGRVVLTDFGIALIEGASTLTRTGDLVGSAEYLAPERATGKRPGIPSDLWSLGAMLYVAVEGVSPFRRGDALSTLRAVVDEPPPSPRRAGPLTPLLEGLLRKDPQERMGSAEAEQLLEAVASGRLTETPVGYVPTALGTVPSALPRPEPRPVPRPVPTPVPAPVPSPTGSSAGSSAGSFPGGSSLGADSGTRPRVAPTGEGGGGGGRVWLIVGAVLALVLVLGGTVALIALREQAGTGGTGKNTPGPGPTPSATVGQSKDPAAGATSGPDPGPTPYTPAPTGTCSGGWVC
ncbi:serine/threonine-protein kinase [Streptomyces sp. C36]|uniref:serine/threonine-protein kinase n=1 Tax=Streptomyces sp. C36 TaxID=3237122 RepID=UPI0034C5E4F4